MAAIKLKWPILGIIIPVIIVSLLGYGSHYLVFRHHLLLEEQIGFQISLTILWISYVIAIVSDPGTSPDNFVPVAGQWKRWCKKCKKYKPERAHHCKSCNRCVLKMDHHCPWTYNCVGHNNMGHFMRFLFWLMVNSLYVMVRLFQRGAEFYHDRDLPSYLVNKSELAAVIALLPIDTFCSITILILYIREVNNWIFKGMTQIEVWEYERIDSQFYSERLWLQIRSNYAKLYGKKMPKLVSWNNNARFHEEMNDSPDLYKDEVDVSDAEDPIIPENFTIDDLIFPYDMGIWGNLILTFNYPWLWLFPWVTPPSDGCNFEKNEFVDDDQLGLPWPPDGGNQEFKPDPELDIDQVTPLDFRNVKILKKRLDPRSRLDRKNWVNDLGENLNDFGVDLDAEDVENETLLSKDR